MKKTVEKTENYCEHCERSFARESTMLKHMCERKRRWLERDKAPNRIGFSSYARFYKLNYNQDKTHDDFIRSSYYTSFVRFGLYCVNVNVVNPIRYIDYLLENKISIDNWNQDKAYTKFLIQYLRHENVADAVSRTSEYLNTMAQELKIRPRDVLRYGNQSTICNFIVSGKISPWVIWHSESGRELLETRLNSEQTQWILDYIDPPLWKIKFDKNPEMVQEVNDLIKKYNL